MDHNADNGHVVVFDIGNVLLAFDHGAACRVLAEHSSLGAAEAYARVFESGLEAQYDKGLVTSGQFFEGIVRACELQGLSFDAFREAWCGIFRRIEGIGEVVAALRDSPRVARLALLSNTNELHHEYIGRHFPEVLSWFDDHLFSYRLHARKPERDAFERAIEQLGVSPGTCVFIDDMEQNMRVAEQTGMVGVQFTGVASLWNRLVQLGLLPDESPP